MRFEITDWRFDPTDRAAVIRRWRSAPLGIWVVDVYPEIYGYRCNVGRAAELDARRGPPGYELEGYCLGAQRMACLLGPALIMSAMRVLDEDCDVQVVRDFMPTQKRRPLRNDLECWRSLCDLAGASNLANVLADDVEVDDPRRWGRVSWGEAVGT